jgi:hypothetical protein
MIRLGLACKPFVADIRSLADISLCAHVIFQVYVPHRQLLALLAQPLPAATATAAVQAPPAACPEQPAAGTPLVAEERSGSAAPARRRVLRPMRRQGPAATALSEAPPAAGTAAPVTQDAGAPAADHVPASNDLAAGNGSAAAPSRSTAVGVSAARRPARSDAGAAAAAVDAQPHRVTDVHVSLLLNAGLLARHASDRGLYLFGVPNTGPLVRACLPKAAFWHNHALLLSTSCGYVLHANLSAHSATVSLSEPLLWSTSTLIDPAGEEHGEGAGGGAGAGGPPQVRRAHGARPGGPPAAALDAGHEVRAHLLRGNRVAKSQDHNSASAMQLAHQ